MYKILHPGIIAGYRHMMVYSFEKKSKSRKLIGPPPSGRWLLSSDLFFYLTKLLIDF
jgi:hypothetical protein